MDWLGWKKTLELLQGNPELIAASVQFAIALFVFTWWLRSQIGTQHIAALNTQISTLQNTGNQHVEALKTQVATVEGMLRHAKDEQGVITKQIAVLKDENTKQAYALQIWRSTVPKPPQQDVFITDLTAGTTTIADSLQSLSKANSELGTTLQGMTVPYSSDVGRLAELSGM
jgi:hypothetical protein